MKEMVGTLRRYRSLLMNWFLAWGEVSNGSVEGLNNKAKLAFKKAYVLKSYTQWESPSITGLESFLSQIKPTLSADEAQRLSKYRFCRYEPIDCLIGPICDQLFSNCCFRKRP
jgi:hypothetical protein